MFVKENKEENVRRYLLRKNEENVRGCLLRKTRRKMYLDVCLGKQGGKCT